MSSKPVKQDRDVLIVSVTIINTPSSEFVLRVGVRACESRQGLGID